MTIFMHQRGNRCPECKGSGVSGWFVDCETCDGEGYVDEPREPPTPPAFFASLTNRRIEMSGASAPCPPDSALMQAWEVYKASAEYANSYSWATRFIPKDDPAEIERIRESGANPWTHQLKVQAVEGSLWAAFESGWLGAGGADPFTAVVGGEKL